MIERYSIIGIVFSATIVLIDLYLLKKHKIDASIFTRWFIIGVAIGVVSLVPASLAFVYMVLGTEVLISAVTVASFMTLLLLIFYLDYRLGKLNDKIIKLVALVSAREYDFDRKHKNEDKSDD